MGNTKSSKHVIDIRFTWNGSRAKEFIELVKEEYGTPIPYGAVGQLVRLACAKFVKEKRKESNNEREKVSD